MLGPLSKRDIRTAELNDLELYAGEGNFTVAQLFFNKDDLAKHVDLNRKSSALHDLDIHFLFRNLDNRIIEESGFYSTSALSDEYFDSDSVMKLGKNGFSVGSYLYAPLPKPGRETRAELSGVIVLSKDGEEIGMASCETTGFPN